MKLDTTTKIVTLVSLIVGIMISVAGYFTGSKLQEMEVKLGALDAIGKQIDNASKEVSHSSQKYDLSSRLIVEFKLRLAREFADLFINRRGDPNKNMLFPVAVLKDEFEQSIPNWHSRKGLMTGNSCVGGLKVRQVVTLVVKNIGYPNAIGIKIKALQKTYHPGNPLKGWQEISNNDTIPYYGIATTSGGWKTVNFSVSELLGHSKSEEDGNEAQIVLASISGKNTFYGTVLIPLEITWTDEISGKPKTKQILETQVPNLMSALLGAEVGTACQ